MWRLFAAFRVQDFGLYVNAATAASAAAGALAAAKPAHPGMASVPRHMPGGGRTAYAGANWSGGWVNPLGADYAWMYDDGPGGSNLAGVCGPVPTDAAFTWAKARKLLHIR
jgi:hypothetical protein